MMVFILGLVIDILGNVIAALLVELARKFF